MLSKVFRPLAFQRSIASSLMKRQFSSQLATIQQEADNHHLNNKKKLSSKDVSDYMVETEKAQAAKNKDYYEMLNDVDARQKFFTALTKSDSDDVSAIKSVKSKIASLIKHEIDELGF